MFRIPGTNSFISPRSLIELGRSRLGHAQENVLAQLEVPEKVAEMRPRDVPRMPDNYMNRWLEPKRRGRRK